MLILSLVLATSTYLLPPKEVIEAFDAKPLPEATLSPSKKVIALTSRRAQPTIGGLSQPMLRIAGARINPKNFGPHRIPLIYAIAIKNIGDGGEVNVTVPPKSTLSPVKFSPDGSKLAVLNIKNDGIDLWVANVATGNAKVIADHINATTGDPCDWLRDNATLVCKFVPMGRGPAPAESTVPAGPNIQENEGKTAQLATYEDMIKTAHDEDLFEYYFTSQLALVNTTSGTKTPIGKPAIFSNVTPSPSGEYVLTTSAKRPFSHLLPLFGVPEDVTILDRKGAIDASLTKLRSDAGGSCRWHAGRLLHVGSAPSIGGRRSRSKVVITGDGALRRARASRPALRA